MQKTTPAVLLSQAGQTPFSNYVIQPDETLTGAIVSSCLQLPEAPSSVVLLHSGILRLALRLSMAFGLWNELFTMPIQFQSINLSYTILKCKLQLFYQELHKKFK